ncbi:MAG TPA: nucleoside-diphosphate sugar epimerase/dehydratase [Hyphomicrobiaceae bacterium]|nr:nucleoside-diphosphate sugar epimerase/dehydratase [Hyphomicrobiaceae bacterium]
MVNLQGFVARSSLLRRVMVALASLSRRQKRAILIANDLVLLNLALWLAMSLRLGEPYRVPNWRLFVLFALVPLVSVWMFFLMGPYRHVTRFFGMRGVWLIVVSVAGSSLFLALAAFMTAWPGIPRSVILLYPVFGVGLVWGSREVAAWLLKEAGVASEPGAADPTKVLIYGAGPAGAQLRDALRHAPGYQAVAFVDANRALSGRYVDGLKVHMPRRLADVIAQHGIGEVLLALPANRRRERQAALQLLEPLAVKVRTLPAIEDLAAGRVTINDLRPVEAEDLLGRDPIPPDPNLMASSIRHKSVMVTGAGGSIGAELVRQILQHDPRRLVIFDAGEAHLHGIIEEVGDLMRAGIRHNGASPPEIISVLGSVLDAALLADTLAAHQVQTIYHAAAYKHVPIVERNAVAGLRNNTFGTALLADAAAAHGVELFVLISTDKAVRPSSIMGASKRLAELGLQARARQGSGTVFTMVRFGNVLDSSGSVVRRFRRQIEERRAVTVTDRNAVRYFMSIPEAAALVIQAGAMATGGDVFVLDMGEPVRIDDLARSMIRLMGLEVRDAEHPDGDIAIEYIGLRPGEKLREELLLSAHTTPTQHPRIFKCQEPSLGAAELDRALEELQVAMADNDEAAIRCVLARTVEGFQPERRHGGLH